MASDKLTDEQQSYRDHLILECMALGYLINRTTEYAVFVSFSGHVDMFQIRICKDKPARYNEEVATTEFYADGRYETVDWANPNHWIEQKRDMLKHIVETRDIPYADMQRVAETIYRYHF